MAAQEQTAQHLQQQSDLGTVSEMHAAPGSQTPTATVDTPAAALDKKACTDFGNDRADLQSPLQSHLSTPMPTQQPYSPAWGGGFAIDDSKGGFKNTPSADPWVGEQGFGSGPGVENQESDDTFGIEGLSTSTSEDEELEEPVSDCTERRDDHVPGFGAAAQVHGESDSDSENGDSAPPSYMDRLARGVKLKRK